MKAKLTSVGSLLFSAAQEISLKIDNNNLDPEDCKKRGGGIPGNFFDFWVVLMRICRNIMVDYVCVWM